MCYTENGEVDFDTLSLWYVVSLHKSLLYSLSNQYVPKCQIFISSVAPTDLNIGAGTADCTIRWSFLYQALRLAGLSESQEKYDHTIVALCVNIQYSIVRQFEFNELRGLFLLLVLHHSDAVVPTDWRRIHHFPAMTAKQMEVFTSFSNCSLAPPRLQPQPSL